MQQAAEVASTRSTFFFFLAGGTFFAVRPALGLFTQLLVSRAENSTQSIHFICVTLRRTAGNKQEKENDSTLLIHYFEVYILV